MLISICIPCYKSAKTLPVVVENIKNEFKNREEDYQIILVNDGSPDDTLGVIIDLCKNDHRITGVNLSKNYGQPSAKMASLKQVKGDVVVFMDDDGQHPAEGIFRLVEKLDEGYDVVYAEFEEKKHSLFRRISSSFYNSMAEWLKIKPKGIKRSSFVAWKRTIADAVLTYKSPFISIGSFLMNVTSKYGNVVIEHRERLEGKSSYNLRKLIRMWLNMFISFSIIPLRISSYLGFAFSLYSFIAIIYITYCRQIKMIRVSGYTSTMIMILLIGGLLMIMLGIIGEYLGRIYMTVSGLKQYYVREIINETDNNK